MRFLGSLDNFFGVKQHGSTLKREIAGGLATFATMAYIIVVNPLILQNAGIPKEPSYIATILSAAAGTLIMALYAKRPFAIAPYMGQNAFIAFTVCKVLGYSWQVALGAVFISGVIFVLVTLLGLRSWFAKAIPLSLKYSFAVGLGFFLVFIGMVSSGFVELGVKGAPVKIGNMLSAECLLSIFTVLAILVFALKKIKGSILLGVLSSCVLAYFAGLYKIQDLHFNFSLRPLFLGCLEVFKHPEVLFSAGFLVVVFSVFVMDFVDTLATLLGVSARAGFLDERGNLPQVEKPMLADALATVIGALLGTTTAGTYIESAAGIEQGARTGLAALVVAVMFVLSLFFAPFLVSIPAYIYGAVLIIVGMHMIESVKKIEFSDPTEYIPALGVVSFTSFTYNLGAGITAGFALYLILKVLAARAGELNLGTVILGLVSILFFAFYPY